MISRFLNRCHRNRVDAPQQHPQAESKEAMLTQRATNAGNLNRSRKFSFTISKNPLGFLLRLYKEKNI